jgi:hypothetical protein
MTHRDRDVMGNEVYVHDGETVISIETLRVLFDSAVGSMDFGSGFWDDDATCAARAVAELLGVDPFETATPKEFRNQYPHAFVFHPRFLAGDGTARDWPDCHECKRDHDHPSHNPFSKTDANGKVIFPGGES